MTGTTITKKIRGLSPFLFPDQKQRQKQGLPSEVIQQWKDMSHFFFFLNGLISQDEIRRFLMAQRLERLSEIVFSFEIHADDLLDQHEKREGDPLSEAHREHIVKTIMNSITR